MRYKSTRGAEAGTTFLEAVLTGLSKDGGLFVPESRRLDFIWFREGQKSNDLISVIGVRPS